MESLKAPQDPELSRRNFLQWAAAGLGGLIAAVLGGAGTAYFVSPALKGREEDWVDIGAAKDIPKGTPAKIEFVERKRDAWVTTERRSSAWILTVNGKDFIAYDPRCTHLGCPYSWNEAKKQFACPCHTATFGMDGAVLKGPPPRGLDRFPLKLVGGRLFIRPMPEQAA